MRILYITNMYPVPDYIYFGIHVKEQIEAIEQLPGIETELYFINGRADKLNYPKSIFKIHALLKSGKFDLVHIHYGLSALFMLLFKPKIPVVVTLHSGELFQKHGYINHLIQRNISLAVVKKADRVIVLNDDMIALLKEYKSKLFKIPCGTNLGYFKPAQKQTDHKKFIIGFPGNKNRKEKNYTLFAEIINRLKADTDIEVIEFHNLTREDVLTNLNKIDLLLMTSTVEGSPQIIKEAMACNKPIVSTAVGDVEYLLDGVLNSYAINSLNADSFIAPIKKIMQLAANERTSDGRKRLLTIGLDAETVAGNVYKLYQDLV